MPSSVTGVQTCALDRKSTRLNSSHTIISYAAFCLKKHMTRPQARRGARGAIVALAVALGATATGGAQQAKGPLIVQFFFNGRASAGIDHLSPPQFVPR